MNPQGMEEHKTRGLKRLALTRLRALSREAARLADRVIATDEATRDEVPRLLGVDPGARGRAAQRHRPRRDRAPRPPRTRARSPSGAARAARAPIPSSSPWAGSRRYKGFGDVLAALAALHAAGRLAARLGLGVVGERPATRHALRSASRAGGGAARATAPAASSERAAPRALRARRRLRPRDALRGLEPRDAGGDGPRPAGRGHARRRHPGQGGGRRDRPPGRARATWPAWPRRSALLARDRARREAMGSAGRRRVARAPSPGPPSPTARSRSTRSCCREAPRMTRERALTVVAGASGLSVTALVVITGAAAGAAHRPALLAAGDGAARSPCARGARSPGPARPRGRASCWSLLLLPDRSCSSTPAADASTATASATTSTSARS